MQPKSPSRPRRDQVLKELLSCKELLNAHGVSTLYLFGSVARDEATASSDVDLLVEFNDTPSLFDISRLRLALQERLGMKIDLVYGPSLRKEFRPFVDQEKLRAA